MILKQYYLGCLSQASYLVGDEASGEAVVVDPRRDVDEYLEDAARQGLRIGRVILTHFHADFVAGHLELRERLGVTIHLGARARAAYDFEPLEDGDEIVLGPTVRLRVLETPGHTPESICILVFDRASGGEAPHAVLTGDTLFVGDVGRPDLLASQGVRAEDLAGLFYDVARPKLLALPDDTKVMPGHGPGSACGRSLGPDTVSTIGRERRTNYALAPMTRQEFVAMITAGQPSAPPYFAHDAALNQRERATLDAQLDAALKPLPLAEVERLAAAGAVVLDVREAREFEAGHLPGSLNIGLSGRFASWAGTLIPPDARIVLVAPPGREREAALRLGRIGLDGVAGFLDGGPAALEDAGPRLGRTPRVDPRAAAALLAATSPPLVVDVRTAAEWGRGHLEGSVNAPLQRLEEHAARLPRDRPLVIHCQTGFRSAVAASVLKRMGFPAPITDVDGGIEAWRKAGLPIVAEAPIA